MKAITIWQPWASLLACGAKKYETRSWSTNYRGPIAIHASKKPVLPWFQQEVDRGVRLRIIEILAKYRLGVLRQLPLGDVIATAELVACHKMQIDPKTHRVALYDNQGHQSSVSICSPELILGDWTSGRYAWEFTNMTMLPEPIPAKGMQGLWNWEREQ